MNSPGRVDGQSRLSMLPVGEGPGWVGHYAGGRWGQWEVAGLNGLHSWMDEYAPLTRWALAHIRGYEGKEASLREELVCCLSSPGSPASGRLWLRWKKACSVFRFFHLEGFFNVCGNDQSACLQLCSFVGRACKKQSTNTTNRLQPQSGDA